MDEKLKVSLSTYKWPKRHSKEINLDDDLKPYVMPSADTKQGHFQTTEAWLQSGGSGTHHRRTSRPTPGWYTIAKDFFDEGVIDEEVFKSCRDDVKAGKYNADCKDIRNPTQKSTVDRGPQRNFLCDDSSAKEINTESVLVRETSIGTTYTTTDTSRGSSVETTCTPIEAVKNWMLDDNGTHEPYIPASRRSN